MTPEDIRLMELSINKKFPEAYVEFLLLFGGDADFIFDFSNACLRDIPYNNECAKQLMDKYGDSLKENQLVISNNQDYALFIMENIDLAKDPGLLLIIEGDNGFEMCYPSEKFSEYIAKGIARYLAF